MWPTLLLFLADIAPSFELKACSSRQFAGASSQACVCNATYCDEFPPLPKLDNNQAAVYSTSKSGNRYELLVEDLSSTKASDAIQILIDPSVTYQSIIGFGGAITGAATWNTYNLKDPNAQDNLISSYFGPSGNEYTLARVPIAASDFSLSVYSYDDTPDDFDLKNFALNVEDTLYKIPFIHKAVNFSKNPVKLFATPWSAPGWMKVDGSVTGRSPLKGNLSDKDGDNRYFKAFANYHLKFFEEYHKNNVVFWGVTIQNEPSTSKWYPSMLMDGGDQRDFIKSLYGPMIRANNITKDLKIMMWDSSRDGGRDFIDTVLSDYNAAKYVDGIGVHWYGVQGSDVLDDVHNDYPEKFILYTEASASFTRNKEQSEIKIGDWQDGYLYARDILDDLNHWSAGWTDWNLVLNATGEPRFNATSFTNTSYDAPIIVSSDGAEFYKQPAYYVLGHFSKYIVPNSTRVFMNLDQNKYSQLQGASFLSPKKQMVVVFYAQSSQSVSVQVKGSDQYLNLDLEGDSITTVVFDPFANQCPSSWIEGSAHPNKCYKLVSDKQEPWFEANYDCSKLDITGSLVSIDDAFENAEIRRNVASSQCSQFYIGLTKGDNGWGWTNNDSSTYRNWKAGYPNTNANQICGSYDKTTGQWTNQDCDMPQCYICQMSLE